MKTETSLYKSKGKVLTDWLPSPFWDKIILVFGDEFCCLGVLPPTEEYPGSIEDEVFDPSEWGPLRLVAAHILTEQEYADWLDQRDATGISRREARDRQEYERLRRKYEAPQ